MRHYNAERLRAKLPVMTSALTALKRLLLALALVLPMAGHVFAAANPYADTGYNSGPTPDVEGTIETINERGRTWVYEPDGTGYEPLAALDPYRHF
jgi:hypothetical protein